MSRRGRNNAGDREGRPYGGHMQETVYSRDGCVFRPAGVVCEAGPGPACYGCGWHPRIEDARKAQVREKLRRRWKGGDRRAV